MDADVSSPARANLLLAGVCCLLFFWNLGVPGLWDEDEPRNATCAREMLERGDLIVPTFNGELRTAKPVFLYWLVISAYSVFGVNEFSARFWSALLATGTVLLTAGLGRKLYSRRVGLWSGLLLASALMFVVAARACTPDSVLIFFVTTAMSVVGIEFAKSRLGTVSSPSLEAPRRPSLFSTIIFYLALGGAVLAKGPVGIVLPAAILGTFLLTVALLREVLAQRTLSQAIRGTLFSWNWLGSQLTSLRVGIGLPLLGLVVIPWYVAVAWQTDGDWIRQFIGAENVGRFLKPMEGHRGPVFYYLVAVLIGFYPASVFLPYSLVLLTKRLRSNPNLADLFLAVWSVVWIGFFSLAGTKLPSYVTPAFPPLAILTAKGIVGWIEQPQLIPRRLTQLAMVVPMLVGLGYLGAIPFVASEFLTPDFRILWVGLIPLISGGTAFILLNRWSIRPAAVTFMMGGIAFSAVLFSLISVQVDRYQSSEFLLTEMKTKYPDLREIGTFRFSPPSFVYYAGRPIQVLRSPDQVSEFISRQPSSACLIVRRQELDLVRDQLPSDWSILASRRRFLKQEEILIVGAVPQNQPETDRPAPLGPVSSDD